MSNRLETDSGVIILPEDLRVITVSRCARCAKVAPECKCGLSAARKEKET